MKIISRIFFVLLGLILVGSTPYSGSLSTATVSLGAGVTDTLYVSNLSIQGDSLGITVEINADSVSGYITYRYASANNYYSEEFANADTLHTWGVKTGNTAVFTPKVPMVAGASKCELNIILTNEKSTTQNLTINVYQITWR